MFDKALKCPLLDSKTKKLIDKCINEASVGTSIVCNSDSDENVLCESDDDEDNWSDDEFSCIKKFEHGILTNQMVKYFCAMHMLIIQNECSLQFV